MQDFFFLFLFCDISVCFRFQVRNAKHLKLVKLDESVIKAMIFKASEIFMSQPMLLELEAPIKICGEYRKFCNLL